ncbi:hypothetical protein [Endozoicomonas numazuensis]|nr:hypothetical protein [Endozoicomonas numazuensis]
MFSTILNGNAASPLNQKSNGQRDKSICMENVYTSTLKLQDALVPPT